MKRVLILLCGAGVWAQQPTPDEMPQELIWVGRDGRVLGRASGQTQMSIYFPELSPDGHYAAVSARDSEVNDRDIWIHDLSRKTRRVLAPAKGNDNFPIWTPDGKDIVFTSSRSGQYELYRIGADSSASPQLLLAYPESQYPRTVSSIRLWFTNATPTRRGLFTVPLDGGTPTPFLQHDTAWYDGAQRSRDGKWLAYVSNVGGPWEVYVCDVANPLRSKKVSRELAQGWAGFGGQVRWRADGGELYYMMGDTMVAVTIAADGTPGQPKRLFHLPGMKGHFPDEAPWLAKYDVTPEGDRFLFVRTAPR